MELAAYVITAGMMNSDHSEPVGLPVRGGAKRARRGAPCAGLFGWRKDAAPPSTPGDAPKAPGRDYPAG
jgi:hypothetical protein